MDLALGLLIGGWIFVLIWVPLVIMAQRKMHPRALFVLFFAELWERFSFYGMRALLILYMTKELFDQMAQGTADAKAYGIYGAYNALLYAAPVIGGLLADRVLGFRRAILIGGIFMALGQFTLASNAEFVSHNMFFLAGLSLLAVGNGFFKPNISSFLGTFYEQNDKRKDSAFTIFYMGINVGAMLAPLTCGYLGERIDWSLGFLVAGLGMVAGLIVFWINMSKYEDKGNPPGWTGSPAAPPSSASLDEGLTSGAPASAPSPTDLATVKKKSNNNMLLTILASIAVIPLFGFLIDAEKVTDYVLFGVGGLCLVYVIYTALTAPNKADGQRMVVFVFLFLFHMIFWALFEQAGGSLNILTDRFVDRHGIEASQFQALNPLYIILLAPVFAWLWGRLNKAKKNPWTPVKFFLGLLQMALGYFIMVLGVKAGIAAGAGIASIPVVFLAFMYLFHTTGELSLSPVGLSVVTRLSLSKVVGFVMGTWFLSIAFAHKIAGKLGQIIAGNGNGEMTPTEQLNSFMNVYLEWGVYVVLGAAAVLLLLVPLLRKWMHGVH